MVKNKEEQKLVVYSHILNKAVLELNEGQLEGFPKNPRYIKDEKFAKLKLSLEQSPEFLKARPLLVYPLSNAHYIIVGGNMRFLAGNEVGITDYPCYIFPKETTTDKLKEYVIKDNIAYGSTDWDALANDDWDINNLEDWGVDCSFLNTDEDDTDIDELFEDAQNTESKAKDIKLSVHIPQELEDKVDEIKEIIKSAVSEYEGVEIK